jgi:hypothetical protein
MARFTVSSAAIATALLLCACVAPRTSRDAAPRPATPLPATIAPEPAPPQASAPSQSPSRAPANASAPASAPSPAAGRPPAKPAPTSGATPRKPAASAPAPVAKPAAPQTPKAATLDLGALEQRLKDTKAIGVFTKLSLKNQVDDLLDELRAFHKGAAKPTAAALRQKFDTLIIKVLTLLQDGDPQLASTIASSREALWGILIDPQKFSQI